MRADIQLIVIFLSTCFIFTPGANGGEKTKPTDYPKSLASFHDYKDLTSVVEKYRKIKLLSLDDFISMSRNKNTIILDSRSAFRYKRKHLKGAINLVFSDFTQKNLASVIPNKDTSILIYCNNNFKGDQVDFPTKMVGVSFSYQLVKADSLAAKDKPLKKGDIFKPNSQKGQILSNQKQVTLALNIPTFINLYGYGYRNIYELDELVSVKDKRIKFEGTIINK